MKTNKKIILILIGVLFFICISVVNAEDNTSYKITLTPEKLTTTFESGKYFKSKVIDTKTKKPRNNVKVTLKIYTLNNYKKITLKSNSKGIVQYKTSNLNVGNHKVILSTKNAKTKTCLIKITKAKPVIKTSGALKVTVKNKETSNPMHNIKVSVKVLSKTYSLKTNKKGIAQVKVKNPINVVIKIKETSNVKGASMKITSNENIKLKFNGKTFNVKLVNNKATKELVKKLKKTNIKVKAREYGNFEKVGALGFSLPTSDKYITAKAGDLVLYNGDEISLFYNSNSWEYTRIGKISNVDDLKNSLPKGDVTFTLSLK